MRPFYFCICLFVSFQAIGMQQEQALLSEEEAFNVIVAIEKITKPTTHHTIYFGRSIPNFGPHLSDLQNDISQKLSIPPKINNAVQEIFRHILASFSDQINPYESYEINDQYITKGLEGQTPKSTFYQFLYTLFNDFSVMNPFDYINQSEDQFLKLLNQYTYVLPPIERFLLDALQYMKIDKKDSQGDKNNPSYRELYLQVLKNKNGFSQIVTIRFNKHPDLKKLIEFLGAKVLLQKLIGDSFNPNEDQENTDMLFSEFHDNIQAILEGHQNIIPVELVKHFQEAYLFLEEEKARLINNTSIDQSIRKILAKIESIQNVLAPYIGGLIIDKPIITLVKRKTKTNNWNTLIKWGLGLSLFAGTIYFLHRSQLFQKLFKNR